MINQECQLQELLIAYDRTGPAYYNITSQYFIRSKTFELKKSAIQNSIPETYVRLSNLYDGNRQTL